MRISRGHFPQKAVMPGVLILEALAQTGAVAILCIGESGKDCILRWCTKMSLQRNGIFREISWKLETKIIKRKGPVGVGEAVANC